MRNKAVYVALALNSEGEKEGSGMAGPAARPGLSGSSRSSPSTRTGALGLLAGLHRGQREHCADRLGEALTVDHCDQDVVDAAGLEFASSI